jgi:hypothetical protein
VSSPVTRRSEPDRQRDFFHWVRQRAGLPWPLSFASTLPLTAANLLTRSVHAIARVAPGRLGASLQKMHYKVPRLLRKIRRLRELDDLAFHWAMDRTGRSYERDRSEGHSRRESGHTRDGDGREARQGT